MRTALFAAASLLAVSILGAAPASAETSPRSVGADPRIKQYTYAKSTVYRLDLAMKFITALEFAPGEMIDSVLMGDSESWQVIRLQSGNVLAVKPLIDGARTNMTVYTSQNTYTFELRAVPIRAGSASLNYRIGFRYPERERAKAASRQVDQVRPRDPNYYVAGPKAAFRPVAVYDDGRRVYVEFPRGIVQGEMPPIFVIGPNGETQIVNSRIYQHILIVDRLFGAAELRLGAGDRQQTVRIVRTDGRPQS